MKNQLAGVMISENGRDGKVEAANKSLLIDFTAHPEKNAVTPEDLFAGAYAACFHSALKSAAKTAHVDVTGSTVIAQVRLVESPAGDTNLAVDLKASIPGVSSTQGQHLLHLAHNSCPYSKAVRGNITVGLALD